MTANICRWIDRGVTTCLFQRIAKLLVAKLADEPEITMKYISVIPFHKS